MGLTTSVAAQTQLSDYQPGVTPEGAVYYLPKTAIRVRVQVEKTTYQPGDFARFSPRFLRRTDVSTEPSVSYRLISLSQEAVGMADTTKCYTVKFNAKSVAAQLTLTDDGRLLAINADAAEPAESPAFTPGPKLPSINPRQFMTEEILVAGSTAKMAELTAREIYDLRENKSLLIKGQADFMPQDGQQMKLMLSQLDMQEQSLTSLFLGTTVCDTTEHILTVVPDGSFDRRLLFRLSQVHGLVDIDDLSGAPYYISVENLKTVPVAPEGAAKKKRPVESGIYVNIPGKMRSTIYEGITALQTDEFAAGQFGNTELLSGELFNKRYTTHLWLNAVTGGVERLDAEQPK